MGNIGFAIIMILAGIGIPIMAAMSGSLGQYLSSAPAATAIIFAAAFAIVMIATAVTGIPSSASVIAAPKHLLFAGIFIAFYALSITLIGPRFGIANAIFCVLLGQMISSAMIDHFGLLGAPEIRVTMDRILGIAFMIIGLFLASNLIRSSGLS